MKPTERKEEEKRKKQREGRPGLLLLFCLDHTNAHSYLVTGKTAGEEREIKLTQRKEGFFSLFRRARSGLAVVKLIMTEVKEKLLNRHNSHVHLFFYSTVPHRQPEYNTACSRNNRISQDSR